MRLFVFLVLILSLKTGHSFTPFQDSILKTFDRVVFDSDYRNFGYSLLFNSKGLRQRSANKKCLDTLAKAALFYEGCICELSIDDYNTMPEELNTKRINIILGELSKRIDTSLIDLKVYRQHEKERGFDVIFGPDDSQIAAAQNWVNVRINCDGSFHILNQSEPYTGHHVWTNKSGEIATITAYKNGKRHGKSYTWYYNKQFGIREFENDVLIGK